MSSSLERELSEMNAQDDGIGPTKFGKSFDGFDMDTGKGKGNDGWFDEKGKDGSEGNSLSSSLEREPSEMSTTDKV